MSVLLALHFRPMLPVCYCQYFQVGKFMVESTPKSTPGARTLGIAAACYKLPDGPSLFHVAPDQPESSEFGTLSSSRHVRAQGPGQGK